MDLQKIGFSELSALAEPFGLSLCGVSRGEVLPGEEADRLLAWQEAGHSADMQYMQRSVEERCDAKFFEPWVTTVLSFAVLYDSGTDRQPTRKGYGKVARYAWGRDYHRVLKKKLKLLGKTISSAVSGEFHWRPVTDSFPLLERAFATRAELGFIGKNTMLIRPKLGSYLFLCEVLTDLVIDGEPEPAPQGECGTCQSCLDKCPTDAFTGPYSLDARKCISYLTIEKRGAFSEWERQALGDWIFGCDVCQDVCPFNHRAQQGLVPIGAEEFQAESGAGGEISLAKLFSLSTEEKFREQFLGTPLLRPGREGLLRNGIAVAVHQGCEELLPQIEKLALKDSNEVVRTTAEWGLSNLKSGCA